METKNLKKSEKEISVEMLKNQADDSSKRKNLERNYVELCGYAGEKLDSREFSNGNRLVEFHLATHENIKNDRGEWIRITMWHKVVAWNKLADMVMNTVQKGSLVNLKGRIRKNSYIDKEGCIRMNFQVVANDLQANVA